MALFAIHAILAAEEEGWDNQTLLENVNFTLAAGEHPTRIAHRVGMTPVALAARLYATHHPQASRFAPTADRPKTSTTPRKKRKTP